MGKHLGRRELIIQKEVDLNWAAHQVPKRRNRQPLEQQLRNQKVESVADMLTYGWKLHGLYLLISD